MALIVGHNGPSRYSNSIANRTEASKGSIGGVKKAGSWSGNVYMRVYNIGNHYTYRIQQSTPTKEAFLNSSTLNPTQLRRGSYYATHSGMLG
jgi:hypothetical protein